MVAVPIHKRKFHTFLSHAHADKAVVDKLYEWISNISGIPVWYDAHHLPVGATIATHLATAITQCRSLILVLSPSSIKSGWVKEEYEAAVGQRTQWKDFRIIPLRIEECEIPGFLQTTKWLEIPHGQGDAKTYGQFLADLYYDEIDLEFEKTRDIYVSRSWKESERPLADAVCQRFMQAGFRLIGDAQDQTQFSEERITSLLASCGGVVAILPDRGQGKTSSYILKELDLARQLHLPCCIVADPSVQLPESFANSAVIRITDSEIANGTLPAALLQAEIETLVDEWKQPSQPHFVFFGSDFAEEYKQRNQIVKQILQRVTAMPCAMGEDIREGNIQQVISDLISTATMMIADISEDNLNTCIEAGIARGAGTRFHLAARAPRRRPPFMFRDQQVWHYADDIELFGRIHRIAYPYRRRVLNWELS